MNQVRIGIVGIGNMGTSHCQKLMDGEVDRAKLVAVCDTKKSRLQWAEEHLKDVKTFGSIEAIIDSGLCDALIIATPHYDHPRMGIQTLKAGLHVLVEKPIGVYTAAVAELNRVASEHHKVFTIMYNQRTNPVYQKVRELVQSGDLGQMIRVNWVITNWFRSEYYFESGGWRATWEGEGGGVLLNQCPHQLDLIQWICGMPKRVRGFAKYGQYHDIEVEDDVTAYFEYENGATGCFITSTGEAPGTNRLEISGSMGKLLVENDELTFYRNNEDAFQFSKTTKKAFEAPENHVTKIQVEGTASQHVGIMENFVGSILDGKDQLAPGIEGIHGLSLSNAIHMSSWLDSWVEFPMDEVLYYKLLQEKIRQSSKVKTSVDQVLDVKGSH